MKAFFAEPETRCFERGDKKNFKPAVSSAWARGKVALGFTASASALALCLSASTSAVASEPVFSTDRAEYEVLQSISHEFGSKFTSGYFISRTNKCLVTLMIAEKTDPEQPSTQTAARVRLVLNPGETAGLDSEEGKSLNFTCAKNATALLVDAGERDQLIALQNRTASPQALASW